MQERKLISTFAKHGKKIACASKKGTASKPQRRPRIIKVAAQNTSIGTSLLKIAVGLAKYHSGWALFRNSVDRPSAMIRVNVSTPVYHAINAAWSRTGLSAYRTNHVAPHNV